MSQGRVKSVFVDFESGSQKGNLAIFSAPMEDPKKFFFENVQKMKVITLLVIHFHESFHFL